MGKLHFARRKSDDKILQIRCSEIPNEVDFDICWEVFEDKKWRKVDAISGYNFDVETCAVRPDLVEAGLSVPVGDTCIENGEYPYRWEGDEKFLILLNGEWLPAYSIDFVFPPVPSTVGYSVDGDDMHWTVECPKCSREFEFEGYFDSTDETKCECGCTFRTSKVWIDDAHYIE